MLLSFIFQIPPRSEIHIPFQILACVITTVSIVTIFAKHAVYLQEIEVPRLGQQKIQDLPHSCFVY